MAAVAQCMTVDKRTGLLFDADEVPPFVLLDIQAWADWIKQYRRGYWGGASSPSWRMMQAKILGVGARGTAVEPDMAPHLAVIDAAISSLPDYQHRAVTAYWLEYAPDDHKAASCGCSPATFYVWLRLGVQSIARYVADRAKMA
jgi:DNA-directed RNA polymerase specialized sigma24 family protein